MFKKTKNTKKSWPEQDLLALVAQDEKKIYKVDHNVICSIDDLKLVK